jgi:hypothetical protein
MPKVCSIEHSIDHVLHAIGGPIHLGLPLVWVSRIAGSMRCMRASNSCLNIS